MDEDSKQPAQSGSLMGVGIALGVAIGAGLGVATDNLALWLGVGIAIGAGLGAALSATRVERDKRDGQPDS